MLDTNTVSLGAILVTNDRSFKLVAGLQLEDWTK